jgi:hypothetical protein
MLVSGQLHVLAALPPGRSPGIHQIERWVGPRTEFAFLKKRKLSCSGWDSEICYIICCKKLRVEIRPMALFRRFVTQWAQNSNISVAAKSMDFAESDIRFFFN